MAIFEHDWDNFPELTNAQLAAGLGYASPHVQITEDFDALVVSVTDGDTVRLACSFRDFTFPLRISNIDAPELSEGGVAAKEWLVTRLEGKQVRVTIDPSNRVGKYGRLIGSIVSGGLNVSEEMLSLTLVHPFGFKKEGQVRDLFYYVPEVVA